MNDVHARARELTSQLLAGLGGEATGLGKQANATITQSDQMIADQMVSQPATPRTGETITGTLKDLILQGIASGAVNAQIDQLGEGGSFQIPAAPNGAAMGSVGEHPEVQKAAAIADFVQRGYSVDEAYGFLKAAESNMAIEQDNMQKAAQINQLMAEGATLDEATWAIKAAEAVEADQIVKQAQAGAIHELVARGVDPVEAAAYVQHSTDQVLASGW